MFGIREQGRRRRGWLLAVAVVTAAEVRRRRGGVVKTEKEKTGREGEGWKRVGVKDVVGSKAGKMAEKKMVSWIFRFNIIIPPRPRKYLGTLHW